MQSSLKAVVVSFVLALAAPSFGGGLFDCLGLCGGDACGCGNPNCCDGCEPGCGCCDPGCGCEPACGCSCEPACGCGSYCADGRKYAGKFYNGGCQSYAPTQFCTPCCGGCNSGCGCEPACGCCGGCDACLEPTCGCCAGGCGDCCEPSCGCPSSADPGCGRGCCGALFRMCNKICGAVCGGGSCGCDGEVYWHEWYNDPPCCNDPCDCRGNWIGPGPGPGCGCCNGGSACGCNGGYSGYGEYGAATYSGGQYYSAKRPTRGAQGVTVATGTRPAQARPSAQTAQRPANPFTQQQQLSRKPQPTTRTRQQ